MSALVVQSRLETSWRLGQNNVRDVDRRFRLRPPWLFGRPLQVTVRPIAIRHRCLSCLSGTLVYCAQTVGWIKMPLYWYGDRPRPRRHCVWWEPSSPTERITASPSHFPAHVYCGQTTVAHLSNCWAFVNTTLRSCDIQSVCKYLECWDRTVPLQSATRSEWSLLAAPPTASEQKHYSWHLIRSLAL